MQWLRVDDQKLLIDAGYTIKFALREQGLTLAHVDAVFITHVHADHCFGLERLGYESRFLYQRKPILFLPPGIREELWDQTLAGVMGLIGEGPTTLDDYFQVVDLQDGGFDYRGVRLTYFQNRHTPGKASYGLLLNEKILFTGATRPIPDIVEQFNPETILHDCTLSAGNPVHASVNDLLDAYPVCVREKMYLMSYEDYWKQHLETVETEFAGFATQGQEFAL